MLIREAEEPDFDKVLPLLQLMGHVSKGGLQDRFISLLESPDHYFVVAANDHDLLGYAWVQNYGQHLRSGNCYARLHDLAVAGSHRRQGIGKALFEAVLDWCRAAKVVELQWQAGAEAAPFYESLGLEGDTKSDLEQYPHYEIAIVPFN